MVKQIPQPAEGFERVFSLVGGHGLFQWRLLLILAWQKIFLTWNHIGYAFLGSVPDHWCHIPELQHSNWTLEQIKMISIPSQSGDKTNDICGPRGTDAIQYDKCEFYDLDYTTLLASSKSFEQTYSNIDYETVTTRRCSMWDYDQSIYKSTVATEFDLVCDNRWMAATIQGSYMAGGIIGSMTFGSLSDRFLGRRRTVLTALTVAVTGTICAAFARSYWTYLLFRVVIAIGANGSMQNCFVLMTEHADKKYRALLGMLELVPFAIGYMILPGLAYCFREWWKLQLSFGLISTSLVVYYWIFPDSPRWLATHGNTGKAVACLYKIARVNKFPKPNHDDLVAIVRQCHEEHEKQLREQQHHWEDEEREKVSVSFCMKIRRCFLAIMRNFGSLMETAEIRKRSFLFWTLFFIVAMVYYGNVFAGNLTSDPYLSIFLGGLMEVPAYTLLVPFISRLGRRPTTIGTFFLTGVCMLGLWKTPEDYDILRLVLAMVAKLFVTSGFAVIYLLGAELYPTELRTTGIAVGFLMGRIGAISAPYILDLTQLIYKELPIVIFGTLSIIGGLISFLLPETRTMEMSDKVVEIEMQAEEDKIRRQSLIESRRQSLIAGSRRQSLVE